MNLLLVCPPHPERWFDPRGPAIARPRADTKAFLKSLWMLGSQDAGRRGYWYLLLSTVLSSRRKLPTAVKLAILGYHFRRVAAAI